MWERDPVVVWRHLVVPAGREYLYFVPLRLLRTGHSADLLVAILTGSYHIREVLAQSDMRLRKAEESTRDLVRTIVAGLEKG